MKKAYKFASRLEVKKSKILLLSTDELKVVVAGEDLDTTTKERYSYFCPPPFNAPPYFYPEKTV